MAATTTQDRIAEIDRNYEAFLEILPELMESNPGRFAVMSGKRLVDVYDTSQAAFIAGTADCGEGRFSVQEITAEPLSLGWFSGVPG